MAIWNWELEQPDIASREEENPYAMPIIVRAEKSAPLYHNDVLIATAQAVAMFLDNGTIYKNDAFRDEVERWNKSRIRKVARRARGARWSDLDALPGVTALAGTAEVKALLPTSRPSHLVSRLQVSGLEAERDKTTYSFDGDVPALNIAVNPNVPMSTGKQMAQVGHIVHLAPLFYGKDVLKFWREAGYPIRIEEFRPENSTILVHDAGFTEVPAGTLTACGSITL